MSIRKWIINKLAGWVFTSDLWKAITKERYEFIRTALDVQDKAMRREIKFTEDVIINKLKAFQAIDSNWNDTGKIIICAHTIDGDFVKIMDLDHHVTMSAYREMAERIECAYGIKPRYADAPGFRNINDFMKL